MKENYQFGYAVLRIGKNKLVNFNEPQKSFFINSKKLRRIIVITLHDVYVTDNTPDNNIIEAKIYKRGTEEPLLHLKSEYDPSQFEVSFSSSNLFKGENLSGVYKIEFSNIAPRNQSDNGYLIEDGGSFSYEFSVIDEDEIFDTPKINFTRGISDKQGRKLRLEFKCAGKYTPNLHFTAVIYTKTYLKIASQGARVGKTGGVAFKIIPYSYLTDGEYCCLTVYMGRPFYKLNFEVRNGEFHPLQGAPLPKDSFYSYIAEELEENTSWNSMNGDTLRSAILRERLSERYKNLFINNLREQNNLARVDERENLLVEDSNVKESSSILEDYCKILSPSTKFYIINSKDLLPESGITLSNITSYADSAMICLSDVSHLLGGRGGEAVNSIIGKLSSGKNSLSIIGSKREINSLLGEYPSLKGYFTPQSWITYRGASELEFITFVHRELSKTDLILTPEAVECIKQIYRENKGDFSKFLPDDFKSFVNQNIVKNYTERVLKEPLPSEQGEIKLYLQRVLAQDIIFSPAEELTCNGALDELMGMVGLADVKGCISKMVSRIKFNSILKSNSLKPLPIPPQHMIFTGNPGTGKTTVAKKIGKIYHSLGLLSKGDILVTERKNIIGRFLGDTENNMVDIINKARGGVLFIDEAYTLCSDGEDKRDYGKKALESLITLLSQDDSDILVILAGYGKQMQQMLGVNPGLAGRFPNHIDFADYSPDELFQIACGYLNEHNLTLSQGAVEVLRGGICKSVERRDESFSNARWVICKIENEIIPALASRVIGGGEEQLQDAAFCSTILESDIKAAFLDSELKQKLPVRGRIGYRA